MGRGIHEDSSASESEGSKQSEAESGSPAPHSHHSASGSGSSVGSQSGSESESDAPSHKSPSPSKSKSKSRSPSPTRSKSGSPSVGSAASGSRSPSPAHSQSPVPSAHENEPTSASESDHKHDSGTDAEDKPKIKSQEVFGQLSSEEDDGTKKLPIKKLKKKKLERKVSQSSQSAQSGSSSDSEDSGPRTPPHRGSEDELSHSSGSDTQRSIKSKKSKSQSQEMFGDMSSDEEVDKKPQRKEGKKLESGDSDSDSVPRTPPHTETGHESSANDSDSDAEKEKKSKSQEVFGEMSSDEDVKAAAGAGDEPIPVRKIKRLGDRSDNEEGGSSAGDASEKENDLEPAVEPEEEEPVPETRIDVEIPKITTDLGKGIHFVKLPNFLSVETRPFDPNTYEDEIDDEETLDEEGRARLKLKVENTIRWREKFNDKGAFVKESNARFVRWSDGSLSLHLGDEIFNVYKQPLAGDHNHLFIRQGTGLQGQAVFRTKLTFRPHSTESFTHRKMTMSLADRSNKTQGIKVLSVVGADPEAHRDEMIKKEEDKLRAAVRRDNKQRRIREKTTTRGLSSSYLDDEYSDDDNSISLAAIKNRYKKGAGLRTNIYSSSEDESDLETKRKQKTIKRLKDSDEEDEDNVVPSASGGGPGNSSPGEPDKEEKMDID